MLSIFLSIAFASCILAAPAPTPVPPVVVNHWRTFKEEKSLERFRSTLLNETFLPLLNECYNDPVGESIRDSNTREAICSRYFDAILQLNSSSFVVNVPDVLKVRDNSQGDENTPFCDQKHNFPTPKHFTKAPLWDFNKPAICGMSCLEDDPTVAKSICRFLAWMGDEIAKQEPQNDSKKLTATSVAANAAAPAVVPVTEGPTKVSKIIQAYAEGSNIAEVIENKPKIDENPEPVKTDKTNAEKPEPEAPSIPIEVPTNTDNVKKNTQQEKPAPTKEEPQIPIFPNLPNLPNEPKEPKEPSTPKEQKEIKTDKNEDTQVQPSDDNNNNTNNKEEPAPAAPKNSNDQDAVQDIQVPKPKLDEEQKQDSVDAQDTDEEGNVIGEDTGLEGDDYLLNNPNKVGIAKLDDNEQNQSNSPEIVNSNDMVNNKQRINDPFLEESGSNFFSYFLVGMFLCIAMYVIYHNKSKVLALLLEGRRGDKGRGGRRKHTAAYRKLDSNLEEAITSSASGRTTQIIY